MSRSGSSALSACILLLLATCRCATSETGAGGLPGGSPQGVAGRSSPYAAAGTDVTAQQSTPRIDVYSWTVCYNAAQAVALKNWYVVGYFLERNQFIADITCTLSFMPRSSGNPCGCWQKYVDARNPACGTENNPPCPPGSCPPTSAMWRTPSNWALVSSFYTELAKSTAADSPWGSGYTCEWNRIAAAANTTGPVLARVAFTVVTM